MYPFSVTFENVFASDQLSTSAMPGLMKRLSKSAGDISPCKRKTRSNSFDEYPDEDLGCDAAVASERSKTDVR